MGQTVILNSDCQDIKLVGILKKFQKFQKFLFDVHDFFVVYDRMSRGQISDSLISRLRPDIRATPSFKVQQEQAQISIFG